MAKTTPKLTDGIFELYDADLDKITQREDISTRIGWEFWQRFLKGKTTKSFRFIHTNAQGFKFSFTGVKQKHSNGWFWYGHKRVDKKLRKKYIGRAENLTVKKLVEVAEYLAQGRL